MEKRGAYDYIFKVIIVGNSGVGKSALMLKCTEGTFTLSHHSTVGVGKKTLLYQACRTKC